MLVLQAVHVMGQLWTVRVEASKKYLETFLYTLQNCKVIRLLKNCGLFHYFHFSLLHDNELGRIKSDGLFGRLPNLVKLDLRRNQITGIEENSFEGASRISEL